MWKFFTAIIAITVLSSGINSITTPNNHTIATIKDKLKICTNMQAEKNTKANVSPQQQEANAIKNKIKNIYLTIPLMTDKTVSGNLCFILLALQSANPLLLVSDLSKMSFTPTTKGQTFKTNNPLSVLDTITVGTGSQAGIATKMLNITMETQ